MRHIYILSLLLFPSFLTAKQIVLFAPDDEPQKHLISYVRQAQTKIHAAVYVLTDAAITRALIEAKQKRNLDV